MKIVDLGNGDGKMKVDGFLGNKKCIFVLLINVIMWYYLLIL